MAGQNNEQPLLTGDFDEDSQLFKNLLIDTRSNLDKEFERHQKQNSIPESNMVAPKPGWCLKTWLVDGKNKIFVNICTSELVLKPKDLSESEVRKIVESEDPTKFRIPMGIGEAHKERDHNGNEADTYDIVIHPDFFRKCKEISFFKEFFIMLLFDGLEEKYELKLNREYKILKNRKAMGTLQMQNIRTKSKPVIMEMDPVMAELEHEMLNEQKNQQSVNNVLSEVSTKKINKEDCNEKKHISPRFSMMQEPDQGHPEYLVFEIELPLQKTSKNLLLDVGEDCLILHGGDNKYMLDLDLPYNVDNENTGAQFHRKTKILTVTLPVLAKK